MQDFTDRGYRDLPRPNMREFTNDSANRNRAQYPYAHALLDVDGNVIFETIHGTEESLRMDVQESALRIGRGEAAVSGQVPAKIVVDGVAESDWAKWIR